MAEDLEPDCFDTKEKALERLIKVEAQLAERLGLDGADIRDQLIQLVRSNQLMEDELVADWSDHLSWYLHAFEETT